MKIFRYVENRKIDQENLKKWYDSKEDLRQKKMRASPQIDGEHGYPSIKQPEDLEARFMKQRQ